MRTVISVLLLLTAFAARLGAASYFVNYAEGSDVNAGTTSETAWKHCPGDPVATDGAAACVLAAGDTVFFKGGVTYVFTGPVGIALSRSGEPAQPITYDGNSAGTWGTGRARFTDNRGGNAVTAFVASAARSHLVFKSLVIVAMGGAAVIPADAGSAVPARFGGGIAFGAGCENVTVADCVFQELGYAFASKPMNAAALAGAGFVGAGVCRDLVFLRCEFSRLAVGIDFTRTTTLAGLQLTACAFREGIVWPLSLPPTVGSPAESVLTVRETSFGDGESFGAARWEGYGPEPRALQAAVSEGGAVTLLASAVANPVATFVWRKNGTVIDGATDAALRLENLTSADAGTYVAVATNTEGAASSNVAVLTILAKGEFADGVPRPAQASPLPQAVRPPPPGPPPLLAGPQGLSSGSSPLQELSAAIISTGAPTATFTFTVAGNTPSLLLIRVMGPTLTAFGAISPMRDPQLQLFRGETLLERNDDWAGRAEIAAAVSRLGTFPFASAASKDAALLVTLGDGEYRVVGESASGATGLVFVEVRELR